MKFARVVFLVAGIYELLVLLPQFFLEAMIGRDTPPPITHPEFFYGFVCVAVAWQVAVPGAFERSGSIPSDDDPGNA